MTETLHDAVATAETAEAEWMWSYMADAPGHVRSKLGISAKRLGGGVALTMQHDLTGNFWSRLLGAGIHAPITETLLDESLRFARQGRPPGVRIQIAPTLLPGRWPELAADRGIVKGSRAISKLVGPVDAARPGAVTDLRVTPVNTEDAGQWAHVVLEGLGFPDGGVADMLAASVSHPNFRAFALWDGDNLVGGGNLHVQGAIASLNTGAVLPTHRRRGGQYALVVARIEAAREAGCRWLVAETSQPESSGANPSYNNMLRAGLRLRYHRDTWLWQPADDG